MINASDPNPGSVVSNDHADPTLATDMLHQEGKQHPVGPRIITAEALHENNTQANGGTFWGVVDGFVVEAIDMVNSHPGGKKKLMSVDSAAAGTGKPFTFSFSRGRNAHFSQTAKRFQAGVRQYLKGAASGTYLQPVRVEFPQYGSIVILGRLGGGGAHF